MTSSTLLRISVVLLCFIGAGAWAGPLFPYQGRLDKDGRPLTGQVDFQFTVYDAPTAGNVLWQDSLASVQVVGGAFSVKLGSTTTIDPATLVSGQAYVQVAVRPAGGTTYTTLAGRQQLLHVPFASASSQDFLVKGNLAVGGGGADGGATVSIVGPASDGGNVGVLQLSSPGQSLIADGQSIDSSGTLQLQTHSGQTTQVGGSLGVASDVNAAGRFNLGVYVVSNTPITSPWQTPCNAGDTVISGGAYISAGNPAITESRPVGNAWRVTCFANGMIWPCTNSYAVCLTHGK